MGVGALEGWVFNTGDVEGQTDRQTAAIDAADIALHCIAWHGTHRGLHSLIHSLSFVFFSAAIRSAHDDGCIRPSVRGVGVALFQYGLLDWLLGCLALPFQPVGQPV